ncbi:MAG: FAD-dependent oxidoreductase [Chryseobacterium sp.]|uniref:flavin-dependent monooxygenase QhpG n=1 Tax=Chryseobacterium sp. TaxID=1871047 RepID=UPI0025C53012|nr:tryptophan 7-halogenase [Chryseobacterium sp.]MCJ7932083.1 FAD-dependent oxidoreductase [Chryseobacterium sp.]
MKNAEHFDVLIIGGGPAGSCAALRLLALGYRVGLVEQQIFPRHQIGESLSAGIRNIFEYLDADHLLELHGYLHALPAQVIWEKAGERNMEFRQSGGGIMVDRGKLDHDMLRLAVSRGMCLFQPAKPEYFHREYDHWKVIIRENGEQKELHALFIIDARGRSGLRTVDKIITAPAMVALYANTDSAVMPRSTLVEAQQSGWLWGAPLPEGKFRIMIFSAPEDLKKKNPEQLFINRLSSSVLFAEGLQKLDFSTIKSCSVVNYSHHQPWEENYIRVGEAAFTLDPLSSTGVEKAMRFSLQTVIAINTVLKTRNIELARNFYEDHMARSVIRHLEWTAGYYERAWPKSSTRFWKERSKFSITSHATENQFYNKLMLKMEETKTEREDKIAAATAGIGYGEDIAQLWYKKIRLSPQVTRIKAICVEDDQLTLKNAVRHPLLEQEIAYVDNVEIIPLLSHLQDTDTFGELMYSWSRDMPFEKARAIMIRLCDLGVMELS